MPKTIDLFGLKIPVEIAKKSMRLATNPIYADYVERSICLLNYKVAW